MVVIKNIRFPYYDLRHFKSFLSIFLASSNEKNEDYIINNNVLVIKIRIKKTQICLLSFSSDYYKFKKMHKIYAYFIILFFFLLLGGGVMLNTHNTKFTKPIVFTIRF